MEEIVEALVVAVAAVEWKEVIDPQAVSIVNVHIKEPRAY